MSEQGTKMYEIDAKGRVNDPNGPSHMAFTAKGMIEVRDANAHIGAAMAGIVAEFVREINKTDAPIRHVGVIGVAMTESLIEEFEANEEARNAALETCSTMLLACMTRPARSAEVRQAMADALRAGEKGDIKGSIDAVMRGIAATIAETETKAKRGADSIDPAKMLRDALSKGKGDKPEPEVEYGYADLSRASGPGHDSKEADAQMAKMRERGPRGGEAPDEWFQRVFGREVRSRTIIPSADPELASLADSVFMSAMMSGKVAANLSPDKFAIAAATGFAKAVLESGDTPEESALWLERAIAYIAMTIDVNKRMREALGTTIKPVAEGDTIGKTAGSA